MVMYAFLIKIFCQIVIIFLLLVTLVKAGNLEDGEAAFKAKDNESAYRLLKPESDKGVLKAQAIIARMYAYGLGIPKDKDLAFKMANDAATKGSLEAGLLLGVFYKDGIGVANNNAEALKWYRSTADAGYSNAQAALGGMYYSGKSIVPLDYSEAIKYFRLAAAQGYGPGHVMIGNMYFFGRGVQQDYAEAMKWNRLAADLGEAAGFANIGEYYELGRGVKQDYREAARWYIKAAEMNPTLMKRTMEKPEIKAAVEQLQAETASKLKLDQEEQLKQNQSANAAQSAINVVGKRVALVIGNANYKTHPLRNPTNDANDVSVALKSSEFQVIDLRDATLQQMRAGVRQFGDRLINNDVGLVYYSGHGVEVKGRNYFIPVNADIQREDEISDQGLDVSLVLEKMSTAGKGVNILIVDACRDDPFGRSFRSSSRGLANMDAPRGTIIAYATSPGKVASDGDPRERNSPYTKNLIKAMQQPNKPIEQVFKEVRRAVQEETKNQQTPWENTSLSGDFYFKVQR
jgi:hypothetical protein